VLAAVCLLLFNWRDLRHNAAQLSRQDWLVLAGLGLLFIAITQGAQYIALASLPAVTVSLLLNTTSLIVAGLGIFWLHETPGRWQWLGVLTFTGGALLYFWPAVVPAGQAAGLAAAGVCVLANALSALLSRQVNRQARIPARLVTLVSMGAGSVVLLSAGVFFQGLPTLRPLHWLYIIWLAVVNTAIAFTLWNRSLRQLSAMESSVINGTMLVQIAILAIIFLGETLTLRQAAGLGLAAAGALLVQLRGQTIASR
jgi:drug/metabolite transporter (DMT)-like permease